jgi:hypothetical protein
MEDDERSGHPRSHGMDENVEKKTQNLVHSDRHLSIRAMVVKETVRKA